ncbi:NACHT domain-containing protein [Planktothrix rubescens]|uniref:NACHT domain-containing protein n=1 Tax=Planktothrix rubescens TaxID=59512 RepID=UPI0004204558|nr:NACHT domain-containing protein [Planktothrix rubescens]
MKIQDPVIFENETPTAINKLVVMSKKQAPRSTVWINDAGLDKIRKRMTEFKKSDNDNKRGKSCWTAEYLAHQAYVSRSTIIRLLYKKVPIDQTSAISILDKLGFESSSFIGEHDQMLKTYNQNQPLSSEVDWQKVCLEMLQEQQEDQQIRRKATEMGFEVKVYVPLGLVERKQQQRRSGIINTEQIHQLDPEVITRIYKHEEFLDDIIGQQPTDQDQHIAIIGEPGAGKTTLLDRIATYIKDKNQDLFICISLANLQGKPIKTYILNEWLPQAIALSYPEFDPESLEKTFQHRLNQGGVWLLLDGADEGKLSLAEIQTEISNFVKIRVVLTCRTNVWDIYVNNPLTRFKTYKTQDFKPEQIDQFIQGWFEQAKDEIRGKELQAKLKEPQRDRIRQLVTNPLRLALLCQIFYKDKNAELPETKAGLYEQFVRYFYEWKPAIAGIDWGTQPQLQDKLHKGLGKLAIAGLDSDYRYRLPLSLIKTEMDDKLFKLAWDLGWLTLVDREEKTDEAVYAFYHPTFQEYFAALEIDNWDFFLPSNHIDKPVKDGPDKYKRYRAFERKWREVILLWAGSNHIEDPLKEEFAWALIKFKDGCNNIFNNHYGVLEDFLSNFRNTTLNDITYEHIDHEGDYDYRLRFWDEWNNYQEQFVIYGYFDIAGEITTIKNAIEEDLIYYLNIWMHFEYIESFIKTEYPEKYEFWLFDAELLIEEKLLTKNKSEVDKLKNLFNNKLNNIFASSNVSELLELINPHSHPCIKGASIARLKMLICYELGNDQEIINLLLKHLKSATNSDLKCAIIYLLIKFPIRGLQTVQQLIDLLSIPQDEITVKAILYSLDVINIVININLTENTVSKIKTKRLIVSAMGRYINHQNNDESSTIYQLACDIAAECSEHLKYEEFWEAWHSQISIPTFKAQLTDLAQQLKPTKTVYPLVINSLNLATETNEEAIANFLSTKIYKHPQVNIPGKPPTVRNAAELQQHLFTIREQLQKSKLALILCIQNDVGIYQEPTPEALAVSLKLVDKELGFYIIWITNQPLDIGLQGFPPEQDNLIGVIQAGLEKLT